MTKAATSASAQVREYIAALPPASRRHLKAMRAAIKAAAPDATEAFSYRIPAFRYGDRALVWYAAFTQHVSLYPITGAIRRTYAAELKKLKTSTGTVQFPLTKPLPVALVKKLVKARVAEARATKPRR
jgi:uncharacterized protein YdhG (YjbR/CyaY superfamily)